MTKIQKMQQAIELLSLSVEGDAICPCCEEPAACKDECTFADDAPVDFEKMVAARGLLAQVEKLLKD